MIVKSITYSTSINKGGNMLFKYISLIKEIIIIVYEIIVIIKELKEIHNK